MSHNTGLMQSRLTIKQHGVSVAQVTVNNLTRHLHLSAILKKIIKTSSWCPFCCENKNIHIMMQNTGYDEKFK